MNFINITAENLSYEHLCYIICSRKPHQGIDDKKDGLMKD